MARFTTTIYDTTNENNEVISVFSFDLQRFANINTANSGTVLSSAQLSAAKDSLDNDLTSYVREIESNSTGLQISQGDGSTYSVTIQGGSGSSDLASATGILSTAHGGLGSSVMATARANLGLGSIATLNSPLPVANGGTGQTLLANVLGVGSATKASQDASGNVITSAYLRKNTSDTLTGSLVVTSTGSIGSNLSVAGGIRSAGTVTMAGAASVGTSLTVGGGESVAGDLKVGGNVTVTGNESIGGDATITGNLRLKGSGNYGNKLNFGDGDYVYLIEPADDQLEIKAKQISLTSSTANQVWVNGTNITALGGGGSDTASTATKLATARSLKVSLASSSAQTFDGSANCTLIGVGGVLPAANGGTGATVLTSVTVGKANTLTTARNIVASLGSSVASSFDGSAAVTVGTQGTLPINKGGTGTTTATPMFYGTCSTAAGTVAKAVTCSGFVLTTGAQITVKFTVTSTAAAPTLNVNSTGAKTIQYQGYSLVSGALRANGFYHFVYDGSYWQVVGPLVWTE